MEWQRRCSSISLRPSRGLDRRPGPTLLRTWQPAELYPRLFERNLATPLGVAHRRSLLERVGLFQESLPGVEEDWDLWKRFAAAGASFLFVPRKSGRYHIRPGSRSTHHPRSR